ncbi:carbohydrate ABC transporter permease [Ruania alba]|uniref:Carbohydrate ABC transporter membrane protein 1, CUT1 family n=1 Tax=Ruania alba TaxID=648782 RepID=A0A1H5LE24_9MICO|nr:sugar ABC transporter permease [Ruania alba]SEE74631.1 carbohydrate ABC transporter membrane protein 1, CUT1 family [Ruania alba]
MTATTPPPVRPGQSAPTAPGGTASRRRRRTPWTLAIPAAAVLIPFLAVILARGLWMSTHGEQLTQPGSADDFVGLENFLRAFGDPTLRQSVLITLTYVVVAVLGQVIIGVSVALLMHRRLPGKGIVRALILVPMVLTPVVAALTWRLLMDPSSGTVNWLLGQIGLGANHAFLADPSTALYAVILVEVWQNTPYVVVIALAGLEALDPAPFEAASLDGAHGWRLVRHVTVPMLAPVLAIVVLLRIIDAAKTFALVQTMTRGGPGTSSMAISNYVYRTGFEVFDIGYSTALAFLTSVALILVIFPTAKRLLGLQKGGAR